MMWLNIQLQYVRRQSRKSFRSTIPTLFGKVVPPFQCYLLTLCCIMFQILFVWISWHSVLMSHPFRDPDFSGTWCWSGGWYWLPSKLSSEFYHFWIKAISRLREQELMWFLKQMLILKANTIGAVSEYKSRLWWTVHFTKAANTFL